MPVKPESVVRTGSHLTLRVSDDANKVIEFLTGCDRGSAERPNVVRGWIAAKMSEEDPRIDDWLLDSEDLLGNKEISVWLSSDAREFLADLALGADTLKDLTPTDALRAIVAERLAQEVPGLRQSLEENASGPVAVAHDSKQLELINSLRPAISRLCPVEA